MENATFQSTDEDFKKANELYQQEKYEEMIPFLTKAAEKDIEEAQVLLAKCYEAGRGVPKSLSDALKWNVKAGEKGNAKAQYYVGLTYYHGQGVPHDQVTGYKWLKKASDQGMSGAQFQYGMGLWSGSNKSENSDRSIHYLKKSAKLGHVSAQQWLGYFYLSNVFCEKNIQNLIKGYKWLTLSSKRENSDAQLALGKFLLNPDPLFLEYIQKQQQTSTSDQTQTNSDKKLSNEVDSVTDNISKISIQKPSEVDDNDDNYNEDIKLPLTTEQVKSEGEMWIKRAADEGDNNDAISFLGNYYFENQRYKEGLEYYKKIADDDKDAAVIVGNVYLNGEHGIEKDVTNGLKYLEIAAEEGSFESQKQLGMLYYDANKCQSLNIDHDMKKAIQFLTMSAEKDKESQLVLGYLYLNGKNGTEIDMEKAQYYIQLASKVDGQEEEQKK